MKKIIIIGCPGSGKSTLAKRIAEKTGYSIYHLDNIWWKTKDENISREEFDQKLQQIFLEDSWIIDGDYSRTYEVRMKASDTIVFLDYSKEQCMEGAVSREGKVRDDCPLSSIDEVLRNKIEAYQTNKRPLVYELLDKYSEKEIYIFTDRSEAEQWISKI